MATSDAAILLANARGIEDALHDQPFAASSRTHMPYEAPEYTLHMRGARGAAVAERFLAATRRRYPEYKLWLLDGGGHKHQTVHAALSFLERHKQNRASHKPWYAGVYRRYGLACLYIRGERIRN